MTELQLQRKDGSPLSVEVQRRTLRSGQSWILVAVARDITERKEAEQRLLKLAHFDTLTGLAEPQPVLRFADPFAGPGGRAPVVGGRAVPRCRPLQEHQRHPGPHHRRRPAAPVFQPPGRLPARARHHRPLWRRRICRHPDAARRRRSTPSAWSTRSARRCASPFDLQGHEVTVTVSIGIAVYPDDGADADTLIQYADTAMYRAKEAGRDAFRFFTAEMNAQSLARLDLENALRRAIDNEEFVLYFQPKVHIGSGPHQRRRGADTLAAAGPRHGVAGAVHPAAGRDRPDRARSVTGCSTRPAARSASGASQQHRPGAPVGQRLGHPVLRRRAGRGGAQGDPRARYRARTAGAGADRKLADVERRRHHHRAAQPEGAGHPDFDRRFRHRLFAAWPT